MTKITSKLGFTVAMAAAALALLTVFPGCASSSGKDTDQIGLRSNAALPSRAGTVLIDGCTIDPWRRATLANPNTKHVVNEVIMLCLIPRADGSVGPRDPSALVSLQDLVADLKKDNYRVSFAITFTDETGERYDGTQTRQFLGDADWRAKVEADVQVVAAPADSIELDLQKLPIDAAPYVTAFVSELAAKSKPKPINVFIPASVTEPSDLPDGDAFNRIALAPYVNRMRIMTLDYSDKTPGPTIDSGWAVDAVRLAKTDFPRVDIAFPLYGTDFGPHGNQSISYLEAMGISSTEDIPVAHGPSGTPFFSYTAFGGEPHQAWFDDAESAGLVLGAWNESVLPLDVGILYYGLGGEDPTFFDRVSARMP